MAGRRTRRWLALVAVPVVLAACSDPAPREPATTQAPITSATASPEPAATPTAPGPVTYAMPLALVVRMSHPVRDVSLADARRVAEGRVGRWSDLGPHGRNARVVRVGGSTSAADVLDAVRGADDVVGVLPAIDVDATVRVLTVDGRHPLRDPKDYPLTVSSSNPVPEVSTVTVAGDIMLGRRVGAALTAGGTWTKPFDPLAARLRRSEITVATFDSTLSNAGRATRGDDSAAADPKTFAGLKRAGFDLLSLATDHLGDYGQRAMGATFDAFEGSGIATVGAGRNSAEATLPVIIVRDDLKIGFLAVDTTGVTPAATRDSAGVNRLDPLDPRALTRFGTDITDLRANVDLVIVLAHWGTRDTHRPDDSQRTAAVAFAKAGADLVVGTHPNRVQGWDLSGSTPLVYALGNLVSDEAATPSREGVFVEATFWGSELKALEPVPYVIGIEDFTPRQAHGDRAADILGEVWRYGRGPYRKEQN